VTADLVPFASVAGDDHIAELTALWLAVRRGGVHPGVRSAGHPDVRRWRWRDRPLRGGRVTADLVPFDQADESQTTPAFTVTTTFKKLYEGDDGLIVAEHETWEQARRDGLGMACLRGTYFVDVTDASGVVLAEYDRISNKWRDYRTAGAVE
jgi:hypothetical protein